MIIIWSSRVFAGPETVSNSTEYTEQEMGSVAVRDRARERVWWCDSGLRTTECWVVAVQQRGRLYSHHSYILRPRQIPTLDPVRLTPASNILVDSQEKVCYLCPASRWEMRVVSVVPHTEEEDQ